VEGAFSFGKIRLPALTPAKSQKLQAETIGDLREKQAIRDEVSGRSDGPARYDCLF
jgi:hypothetical protein